MCITFEDVNFAIRRSMQNLKYTKPNRIDNLEPPPEDIAQTAEVIQEATRMLANYYKLSHDEILNGLPLIDMSRTIFWPHCPAHVKPMKCEVQRYRTMTAHFNNLENPSWGAVNTAFVRYLPPVYSNGIDGLRPSTIRGRSLPHPRMVIRSVHRDQDRPSTGMTIMFMSWGQFIDHDLALAMPPRCKFLCVTLVQQMIDTTPVLILHFPILIFLQFLLMGKRRKSIVANCHRIRCIHCVCHFLFHLMILFMDQAGECVTILNDPLPGIDPIVHWDHVSTSTY